MAASRCPYCTAGADDLEFVNGVLTCNVCGQQLQGLQEETEFQQGIDDVRGRRAAAGTSNARNQLSQAAQIAREEQQAAQQLKDATLLYVRSLQQLLKAQAHTLQSEFGVSSRLMQLLREMWLTLLPQTGILEPAPHKELPKHTTTAAAASAESSDSGDDDEGTAEDDDSDIPQETLADMTSAQLVVARTLKRLLWKMLHPQVTLQLCFIGCVLLREAVTHQDIMSWALDGRLPFLQLPALVQKTLPPGVDLSCLPVRCIQPQLTLDPASFFSTCCELADRLGVKMPPPAGEALLLRAVNELGLPKIVYEASLQLYATHIIDSELMKYQVHSARHRSSAPYIWLAAVLVITMKMLYGLGGSAGGPQPTAKAVGPPQGWLQWSEQVVQKLPGLSALPLTEEEVLALGPQGVKDYMAWCRQYMFNAQPVVKSLDDMHRLFLSWYEASDAASGQVQQQQQQQQRQVMLAEPARDCIILRQEMQPASVLDSDQYAVIATAPDQHVGSIMLDPQLRAVITAVSAYFRMGHHALIQCVKKLEQQMAAVESRLSMLAA